MKRFLKIVFIWSFLLGIIGCGDGGKEAKELLARLLQVVGIPYEMVVNICQDGNGNGFCDKGEIHAKIAINKWDTADSIMEKIKLDENGTYLLEHYDPTKKILMEVEDINKTKKRVTLAYIPKDPKKVKVQELSILQALIDKGLMQEEEIEPLKKSKKARELVDDILLENLFYNQEVLEEQNLPTPKATELNLEYIAEGLKDINVSGDFVERVENNESNTSAIELIKEDIDQQTEIDRKEAKIIAETNSTEGTGDRDTVLTQEEGEDSNTTTTSTSSSQDSNATESDSSSEDSNATSEDNNSSDDSSDDTSGDDSEEEDDTNSEKTEKNASDGYIIKLSSPAKACCIDGNTYESSLTVGAKGLITFEGVALNEDCNISVPKGATIDSNNNGKLDSSDVVINFDMKAPADAKFISPLTTLLISKMESGEDVTELKAMVKDFDPVSATSKIAKASGTEKNRIQKLMALLEVTKTALKDSSSDISSINISSVVNDKISFKKLNMGDISSSMSGSAKDKAEAKGRTMKDIITLLDVIDSNTIDIDTFIINISDGGLSLIDAFKKSVLDSVPSSKKTAIDSASSINDLVPNITKSSYSSSAISDISSYFSTISSNLQNIFNGNFSIQQLDINISIITPSRNLSFTNIDTLNKIYPVANLDDLFISHNINYYNYDTRYQKSYNSSNDPNFRIETNYVSKFEIVDGLDSKFFQISKGNRNIAYIDLKDDIESPTPDNPQDYNHDGIYEVEVKATDVQMLESKTVLLRFKVSNSISPLRVKKGYISRYATSGGLVLDTNNSCCFWHYEREEKSNIIDIGNLDISNISLEGDGSEDFEIIDNKKIKVVADSLDYDNMPIYNLKVVATDINGAEYEQNLTIELWNNNKSIDFKDREKIENKIFKRITFDNHNMSIEDYSKLEIVGAFVKFEILDELDSKFFNIYICCSRDGDSNSASLCACLDKNSSLNPTYKTKEDKNKDGIYEVKVKATDIQTLESSIITLKFELVSSRVRFYNDNWNNNNYDYTYSVPENTVVGGEVPYSAFYIDKANDVNITELYLDGNGSDDFNITTRAIVVAKSLDISNQSDYNLTIVMKDSTGATYKQNILINVGSPENNSPFEITNMNNILPLHRYIVSWHDWWNFYIKTNNLAKMELSGEDINTSIDLDYYYQYDAHHGTHFGINRRYKFEDGYPTYLNPKDADGDNIYKFSAKMIDIHSLKSKQLDFTIEMLSHQVRPYGSNGYTDGGHFYTTSNSLESNLSIPAEAPIGGELLTVDGAKGFYTRFGKDIALDSISLEGDGADKFKVVDNTITLNKKVSAGEDYNLTLVVSDDQSQESRNPIYIHIDSIF